MAGSLSGCGTETLVRLQDTTAQIRLRGAFVLLTVFVVLATRFGLEAILGAFLAGAALRFVDRGQALTHPQFRQKLDAAGFGIFIPCFFVASGVYRPLVSGREAAAAGFLQSTSIGFLVVATQIGQDMGLISAANAAAAVAAGLLSVIVFPLAALTILDAPANRPSWTRRPRPSPPRRARGGPSSAPARRSGSSPRAARR
jgi:Kef-type K+ transport system membrane component KefB